jgi:hypothetical protein
MPSDKTKINCPYKCIHTNNRESYAAFSDVRVFHERHFDSLDLPPNNPKALNVYYTLEPPYLTFSRFNDSFVNPDYFNATASYRSSSEVYYPYDYFMEFDGSETADDIWTQEQVSIKLTYNYFNKNLGREKT